MCGRVANPVLGTAHREVPCRLDVHTRIGCLLTADFQLHMRVLRYSFTVRGSCFSNHVSSEKPAVRAISSSRSMP